MYKSRAINHNLPVFPSTPYIIMHDDTARTNGWYSMYQPKKLHVPELGTVRTLVRYTVFQRVVFVWYPYLSYS